MGRLSQILGLLSCVSKYKKSKLQHYGGYRAIQNNRFFSGKDSAKYLFSS